MKTIPTNRPFPFKKGGYLSNPNKKLDTDGSTALHAAAVQGHLEVVALLLKQPGIDWNQAANDGSTAFHLAAACGHQQVVARLLEQPGVDLTLVNNNGWTALHFAAAQNHLQVVVNTSSSAASS